MDCISPDIGFGVRNRLDAIGGCSSASGRRATGGHLGRTAAPVDERQGATVIVPVISGWNAHT